MGNASRFCVSSLRRGHANLLCIVPILVYVQGEPGHWQLQVLEIYYHMISYNVFERKKKLITSVSEKENANSTQCSQAVTHPSTNQAQHCLTSVIGRELVCSMCYGRWQIFLNIGNSNFQQTRRSSVQVKPKWYQPFIIFPLVPHVEENVQTIISLNLALILI